MHLMDGHSIPKPCCAPRELSPIMVLYFDDEANVVMKKYKNMVVKSFSCFWGQEVLPEVFLGIFMGSFEEFVKSFPEK